MGERIIRHKGVPVWAPPPPDLPQSGFGATIDRLEELRVRIREEQGNWSRAQPLKKEWDDLLIGVLSRGLSADFPAGVRVRFGPSESDPEHSLRIAVSMRDSRHTYYLRDQRRGRTPFQEGIVRRARAQVRSRG